VDIETIFVHIEGAVNSPGIKKVPKGTRLFEVINFASGECKDADISKINLASIVKDEQKIYVPYKESELTNASAKENSKYININSASSEDLQRLEGIGPSMAERILDYREEVGYFGSIEDIKNVSGIGEAKYNKIKDYITI
jgi:competence protein ComEA